MTPGVLQASDRFVVRWHGKGGEEEELMAS